VEFTLATAAKNRPNLWDSLPAVYCHQCAVCYTDFGYLIRSFPKRHKVAGKESGQTNLLNGLTIQCANEFLFVRKTLSFSKKLEIILELSGILSIIMLLIICLVYYVITTYLVLTQYQTSNGPGSGYN